MEKQKVVSFEKAKLQKKESTYRKYTFGMSENSGIHRKEALKYMLGLK